MLYDRVAGAWHDLGSAIGAGQSGWETDTVDGRRAPVEPVAVDWGPLTPRQAQVAWLIARGWSSRAIARALAVTEGVVDGHARDARRRLGCTGRVALAQWVAADRARWARPPSDGHGGH